MKRSIRTMTFVLTVMAQAAPSSAYVTYSPAGVCGGSVVHWERPNSGTTYVSFPRNCMEAMPIPSGQPTLGQMFDAGGWAHWMWYREGLSSVGLQWTNTTCIGLNARDTSWRTSSWDTKYHVDSFIGYGLASNTVGRTDFDHWCSFFGAEDLIRDARVLVRTQDAQFTSGYSFGAQNSLAACLSSGLSVEFIWSHEVGHAYGLDHNDAWQTLMNTFSQGQHHCNVGAGFHQQPFSDETQFMETVYRRTDFGTRYNISGTPMFWNGTIYTAASALLSVCRQSGSVSVTPTFTYMNHYDALPSSPKYRVALTSASLTAPPTASDIIWVSAPYTIPATAAGATYNYSYSFSIPGYAVPTTGARVWLQLDPNQLITETDEGDNLVPTNILITGVSSC